MCFNHLRWVENYIVISLGDFSRRLNRNQLLSVGHFYCTYCKWSAADHGLHWWIIDGWGIHEFVLGFVRLVVISSKTDNGTFMDENFMRLVKKTNWNFRYLQININNNNNRRNKNLILIFLLMTTSNIQSIKKNRRIYNVLIRG